MKQGDQFTDSMFVGGKEPYAKPMERVSGTPDFIRCRIYPHLDSKDVCIACLGCKDVYKCQEENVKPDLPCADTSHV